MNDFTDNDLDQMILAWVLVRDQITLVSFAIDYATRMDWGNDAQLTQKEFWSQTLRAQMRYCYEQAVLFPSYE